MSITDDPRNLIAKVQAVIESCKTEEQLKGAYVMLRIADHSLLAAEFNKLLDIFHGKRGDLLVPFHIYLKWEREATHAETNSG